MASSFGRIFKLTTWGESHGPALGVVIEGCPAGIPLTVEDIQVQLNRRRVGQSAVTTPRGETDRAELLSGVFEGITTGTPITPIGQSMVTAITVVAVGRPHAKPGDGLLQVQLPAKFSTRLGARSTG